MSISSISSMFPGTPAIRPYASRIMVAVFVASQILTVVAQAQRCEEVNFWTLGRCQKVCDPLFPVCVVDCVQQLMRNCSF